MKKLMIAMAAVAMACAANAAASYNYEYQFKASPYAKKDTTPGAANVGWYSCYGMTQATARELLGKTTAVTYSDVAKWLGDNFAENSADLADAAQACSSFLRMMSNQYVFTAVGTWASDYLDDAIGVALFNNGTDFAYEVMTLSSSAKWFNFNDKSEDGASSGWIAVPEPTSGLLMLLGMAGLALKRKRA